MAASAAELKIARQLLGWDARTMGRALRVAGDPEKAAARVLDMEAGKCGISRPIQAPWKPF